MILRYFHTASFTSISSSRCASAIVSNSHHLWQTLRPSCCSKEHVLCWPATFHQSLVPAPFFLRFYREPLCPSAPKYHASDIFNLCLNIPAISSNKHWHSLKHFPWDSQTTLIHASFNCFLWELHDMLSKNQILTKQWMYVQLLFLVYLDFIKLVQPLK